MLIRSNCTRTLSSRIFSFSTLVAARGTNVCFRTNAESSRRRAKNLTTNDAEGLEQPCPRRQMEEERSAGVFDELELDPGVESVQMDANHARRPEAIAGGERSLIERREPAVRHGHLVVRSEKPWCRRPALRRRETCSVCVNGRKVHDSSVYVAECASAAHLLPRMGVSLCWVRRVGFYALTAQGQAK